MRGINYNLSYLGPQSQLPSACCICVLGELALSVGARCGEICHAHQKSGCSREGGAV